MLVVAAAVPFYSDRVYVPFHIDVVLSSIIFPKEPTLRATPANGVNFIPYMKLLGVE
jgi:hypothetical protein